MIYNVMLISYKSNCKLPVISAIRKLKGFSLCMAKSIVENLPIDIAENASYEDATKIALVLSEAGANTNIFEMKVLPSPPGTFIV